MSAFRARLVVGLVLQVACRNEPPSARGAGTSRAPTRPDVVVPLAPPEPSPPALRRVSLLSDLPIVERVPPNRWRITCDIDLRNETGGPVEVSLTNFSATYLRDAGVASVGPRPESVLAGGVIRDGEGRSGRLVFELPAPSQGAAVLAVRWAPEGREAVEVVHPARVVARARPAAPSPAATVR